MQRKIGAVFETFVFEPEDIQIDGKPCLPVAALRVALA
jgi:hypothetical protein